MVSHRTVSGVAIALFVAMTVALAATSCRCTKTNTEPEQGTDAGVGSAGEGSGAHDTETPDGALLDASRRFVDASPRAFSDPDGPVDPVCSGREISFAVAVVDERCAIGSLRAKALRAALERDGGVAHSLRQEATIQADGRVSLRMLNTGPVPLTLPLSWSAKLPSFTVLAEDEHHAIFELAPPHFEPSSASGGADASARGGRAHFARIVLPPGGAAVALLAVDTAITKELTPPRRDGAGACRDGGACAPSRLARGRYVLHIGELFTDVEAGPPARAPWVVP